jgi:DNA-binding HxlR family transcriptional regulator
MERGSFTKEDLEYIRNRTVLFSQKWTVNIVLILPRNGSEGMGFNELMRQLDGISAAVLSGRLKTLQRMGYVERKVNSGPPTRTKYSLSDSGKHLIDTANQILDRREKYGLKR